MLTGKNILVTGGAGFVGSHLCERLLADGNMVVSLDNYFTGSKDNHVEGVTYVEGHTRDIETVVGDKYGNFDLVYHLGEYSRVEKSLLDSFELIFELNKIGTMKVLEFCNKRNIKIIYSGSSTKFGDDGLARDATPYAWTKATNTELVKNYGNWYGLKYAITYFYNVTGGRERSGEYGTLIGIYRDKFLNNEPLGVVLPGTQRRNFTHILDIIEGLIIVGEKGEGDNFGIGDDRTYSILEIANMFGGEFIMLPERKGNRSFSFLDTTKTRDLGWETKHSIEEEIQHIKKMKNK